MEKEESLLFSGNASSQFVTLEVLVVMLTAVGKFWENIAGIEGKKRKGS